MLLLSSYVKLYFLQSRYLCNIRFTICYVPCVFPSEDTMFGRIFNFIQVAFYGRDVQYCLN